MNGDRRHHGLLDRALLLAALLAGALALSIQVGLAFITFSLMDEMRQMDEEHKHLLKKSTSAL